jgi:PAS domain S-box-containing protein
MSLRTGWPVAVHFHRLYALILDSIQEGVFTVDRDFRVTSFNAEAERITGLSRDEAVGRKCYEVFRASVCQTSCALRRTLETGKPLRSVRIDVLAAEMQRIPISVSTAVLKDPDGALIGGVEIFRDLSDVEALRNELTGTASGLSGIVGRSPAMQALYSLVPDVAASDAPVLVTGPSGTGKELVAEAIHQLSARKDRPFVRVNCAALPDSLLESELFGYVRGAFTDARRDKPGRFMLADGGTLFLDEVGDLSPAFQVKLLRVLEDGEVHPLGATISRRVDVRIIAATHADLARKVRRRSFREDLYYRLRVVEVELPPLSERRGDIPLLVDHFVRRLAVRTGRPIDRLTRAAMRALCAYDFPGNVRELRNAIERAFVLCRGSEIDLAHLPTEIARGSVPAPPAEAGLRRLVGSAQPWPGASAGSRARAPVSPPAELVLAALEAHRWNRATTARALGIGRNTLWRRMKEHGLLGKPQR